MSIDYDSLGFIKNLQKISLKLVLAVSYLLFSNYSCLFYFTDIAYAHIAQLQSHAQVKFVIPQIWTRVRF